MTWREVVEAPRGLELAFDALASVLITASGVFANVQR